MHTLPRIFFDLESFHQTHGCARFFFSSYAEPPPPRSWWNHSTLTPKVSVQLEAVNQWRVSTRTINLHPATLVSCSLPFQQGSYFSARPSLLVRQSGFHLLIRDFFNLLCSEGPWRKRHMSSLLSWFIYCVLSTSWWFRCFYFPSMEFQWIHS